jgi:hypothetical protein
MRPELRDEVLAGMDAVMQVFGEKDLESAMEKTFCVLDRLHQRMSQVRTREQFAAMLDAAEVSPEEEPFIRSSLRILPGYLITQVKKLVRSGLKDLPSLPAGRKAALTPEQQADVCSFIGALFARGVSLRVCKQRAAQQFGVSVRTIERAWQHRAELATSAGPDYESTLKWLAEGLGSSAAK